MKRRKKFTQETAISLLTQLYPNLDFSESQYKNQLDKIKVICPIHGEFYKSFLHMAYMNQGCPECGNKNKHGHSHKYRNITEEEFLVEVKRKLKNKNITFEKTKFIKMSANVIITCRVHGDTKVLARYLYQGKQDCKFCGAERAAVKLAYKLKDFKNSVLSNNNLLNSVTVYYDSFINRKHKVKCMCSVHGEFEASVETLVKSYGCPKCTNIIKGINNIARAEKNFYSKISEVHGDKYDLKYTKYRGSKSNVIVICKDHGAFEILPHSFMAGFGCPYCSGRLLCPTDLQNQVDMVHGARKYICNAFEPMSTTVTTNCTMCGNIWEAYPQSLRKGIGCPNCEVTTTGFRSEKPGTLYNIKFTLPDGEVCYKVGITNHSPEYRLFRMGVSTDVNYEVLDCIYYAEGAEAYAQEQLLLKQYSDYRYTGTKFLENGFTELFTVNPFTYSITQQ